MNNNENEKGKRTRMKRGKKKKKKNRNQEKEREVATLTTYSSEHSCLCKFETLHQQRPRQDINIFSPKFLRHWRHVDVFTSGDTFLIYERLLSPRLEERLAEEGQIAVEVFSLAALRWRSGGGEGGRKLFDRFRDRHQPLVVVRVQTPPLVGLVSV
ncbi:hypothetical protein E2C01_065582 [Portunus trituberculatus]|uniref:Uncharacterized protein n=1 Tax=Portunus trituberculatus TaxID=210409 RepID=A0A5B7HRH3_PORTR|nr:hypothetical protein [Portunus trituberculatus]